MIGTYFLAAAALVGQPAEVVNVPYPLPPDEAARDFMRAVDRLAPRPWTRGIAGGSGPFLTVGVLVAKTAVPDGGSVLMVRLPSDDVALVRSPSSLPELAIGQRAYMIVRFGGPDGQAVANLDAIALACDLGTRSESLDRLLGIAVEEDVSPQEAAAPQGGPSPHVPSPAAQPAAASGSAGYLASSGPQRPARSGAATTGVGSYLPRHEAAASTGPVTATGLAAGAWSMPLADAQELRRVQFWKNWIARCNSKLSEAEREAIVRWVLYYSAYYGVDHRLIFAVMKYESNFDPGCVSHAGAIGLMQLMPGTARHLGVNPWVVEENIKGGIQELAGYLDQYSGRSNYEQCALALACYNAGPNRVKRAGGIPNIPETTAYVRRVTDLFYELVKSGAP